MKAKYFTLIELIMVMGVMILLASVAIPAYSSLFSGRKTTLAASKLNALIMEARAHAVSSKTYTAIVFGRERSNKVSGYTVLHMVEVYHNSESDENNFIFRRWVPGYDFLYLPENTIIPYTKDNKNLGMVSHSNSLDQNEIFEGSNSLNKVSNIPSSNNSAAGNADAIIFKPNGQLARTGNRNIVVRFAETNRYEANPSETPKLPLNINWLTCKTKFLNPVK